jgi:hypothetical protein
MFNQFASILFTSSLLKRATLSLLAVAVSVSVFAQGNCTLACNSNVQVSLDNQGKAVIEVGLIAPFAALSCPNDLSLTVFDPQNNPIPSQIDCSRLNQTLPVRVTNTASGNVCFGSVVVKDYLHPVLICPDKYMHCNGDSSVLVLGMPLFTDNCTQTNALTVSKSDQKIDLPCYTNINGQTVTAKIERTWLVSDISGNSSTCIEDIWLRRSTIADVTYPNNRDGFAGPFVTCGEDPNDLSITGQPLVHGRPLINGGDCELVANKTDQIVNVCQPAGYKIFRTWTVSDYCASTFTIHVQIIEVKDFTPPMMQQPPNITVGVEESICKAIVTLPQPTTTDDCSAVTVTPNWAYGTSFGPTPQVPIGTHVVTYTARDACNNSVSKTATVTVVDDKVPVAICKGNILLSLPSSGLTLIFPNSVDNGSYDACSQVTYGLSRDSVHFFPRDTIKCADVNDTIKMFLGITDAAGLKNTCYTYVYVRDQIKPVLNCPPSINITCLQNPTNLSITGQATATDNCSVQTFDYQDSILTNTCKIGTILRRWRAVDPSNNIQTCPQTITQTALSTIQVTFPSDITVSSCANPSMYQSSNTGSPTWTGLHCGIVTATQTDDIVNFSPPACFTIFRKWKVYDECIYQPNQPNTPGYWEKTQKISILDPIAPVIHAPASVTVNPDRPDCKADVLLQPATWTDCNAQVTILNNSLYSSANGANASGIYPVGVHLVVFTATDGCGNVSVASTIITVKDTKAPTAVCQSGLSFFVNTQGKVTINPSAINGGSSDFCTPQQQLVYSLNIDTFSCNSLGAQNITLFVRDLEFNTGSCQTYVLIKDNNNTCFAKTYIVSGAMIDYKGDKVNEIPVYITSNGKTDVAYSDALGKYIQDNVIEGLPCLVKPKHTENYINGVNVIDVLQIQRHILGLAPLGTAYQQLAADVNNSKSITSNDIVELRKLVLGAYDTFPKVHSWRFVPSGFTFTNPNNPFSSNVPDSILFNQLNSHHLDVNFVAIKMGDVNGSANTTDTRSGNEVTHLEVRDQIFAEGDKLQFTIQMTDWANFDAFQFDLNIDTTQLEILDIEYPDQLLINSQLVDIKPNRIAIAWDNSMKSASKIDTTLMIIHAQARRNGALNQALSLSESKRLQPIAFSLERDAESKIDLVFTPSANLTPFKLQFTKPWPNPSSSGIYLACQSSVQASSEIMITDLLGRVVAQLPWNLTRGQNIKQVDASVFPADGVYFYAIKVEGVAGYFDGKVLIVRE